MEPVNPATGNPEVLNQNPKPNSSNNLTVISMALFVVMSLSLIIFLYTQNQQLKGMLASYQTPAASPTPTATADPTANWKTYANVQYGISFKYPSTWAVEEKWGSSGFVNFHYIALVKNQGVKYGPEPGAFGITAYDNPKNLSLQAFESANSSPTGSIGVYDPSAKSVTLGNLSASFSLNANCEPVLCSKYVISSNSKIFFISTYNDAIKDDKSTVDQILSTFKFTSATPSAVPSKTPVSTSSASPFGY